MNNTIFSMFSATRETGRLICVWVPTGNLRTPLACVWIEEQHYPADRIVPTSPIEEDRGTCMCA